MREEYECGPQYGIKGCPAAWDGLHPNELGEYQIARGFSRALVSALGIGKAPLEVPKDIPRRPLPPPSNFQVASSAYGVTATWNEGSASGISVNLRALLISKSQYTPLTSTMWSESSMAELSTILLRSK